MNKFIVFLLGGVLTTSIAFAGSLEKAELLRQNNLVPEAKKELIDIVFSKDEKAKPEAYYLLGTIAFSERNISAALDTWKQLIKKYPKSEQSLLVKDRIKQLSEYVGDATKEKLDNAIAQSYLNDADFWSEGKSTVFRIDPSFLPVLEMSIKWYNKVIKEFPNSVASRLAYEGKMKALIGWKESGQYGETYGIKKKFTYDQYMDELLKTFAAFELEHPEASSLQPFRYQIAQAYWDHKEFDNARVWLRLVIEKAGSADSFYKHLAEYRLVKLEY